MGLNLDTLMSLKVTELKAELKKRGLSASGLKQVLVVRLREDLLRQMAAENSMQEGEKSGVEEEDALAEEVVVVSAEKPSADATPEMTVSRKDKKPAEEKQQSAEPVANPLPEKDQISEPSEAPGMEVEASRDGDAVVEQVAEENKQEPVAEGEPNVRTEMVVVEEQLTVEERRVVEEQPTSEDEKGAPNEPDPMDLSYGDQEKEPGLVTPTEATRSASPSPQLAREEASRAETEQARTESAHQVSAETPTMQVSAEQVNSSTISLEETTTLTSDDALPDTVVTDSMDTDPVDSLKRKRRPASPPPVLPEAIDHQAEVDDSPPSAKKQRADSPPRRGRDARFKGLFNDAALTTEQSAEGDEDEAPIEPSLHPATRALYIRNLVRPLQEHNLRTHVLSLASRNDENPADGLIETFYLDSIKSHALIVFESLTAANRVRVGIHNKIFPLEKTRKPLWADFVPEESVSGWIEREKARGMGGRWEVVYDNVRGGEVTAELVEAGMGGMGGMGGRLAGRMGNVGTGTGVGASAGRARGSIDISNAPSGPRDAGPLPIQRPTQRRKVVMNLDELFLSTRTKPKLYYLPVDQSVASARLAKQGRDSRGRY